MTAVEFRDFSAEHLAPAGQLLAARHARQRAVELAAPTFYGHYFSGR